ncbi:MAG: pilus assembly protein [Rhodospirillales bacterium]|nr:pilus assembly protein [Rhodospirillales bacterium]MCW8953181.1 pilus assembly protein [Rhodospirillales bacterium]MCW9040925.1 pilus assembly protein [Rhodospirillales bacterium]
MRGVAEKIIDKGRELLRSERGSVAAYTAIFSILALGMGAVAMDFGRIGLLRSQMQDRADAGALAGATQLDGRPGAQARAQSLAINAMSQYSGISSSNLGVQTVNFYSAVDPAKVAAVDDNDSNFIEVVMAPQSIANLTQGIFDSSVSTNTTVQARAVAQPNPFICHAPPLMICDPGEIDATVDLDDSSTVGRQIVLKPAPSGGTAWAPGNYGLLALPDGSIGADVLKDALAAVQPQDCYGLDVDTAPGVKTSKIQDGINARFYSSIGPEAPNVINYPQDDDIVSGAEDVIGNGAWDINTYWSEKHGGAVPAELSGASRYQVYLYEQGETFARNGKQTAYPVDGGAPAGYTVVTPPAEQIPEDINNADDPNYDGVPAGTVASNGALRRVVQVAVLECQAEGVRGHHTYPTNGHYLEMFITQEVPDAPEGAIYAEIIRPITPTDNPDFHSNVRLVE